jgi:hypothetical protein
MHSTITTLLPIVTNVAIGFNEKKPASRTVMVSLEISKAFDAVYHDLLLDKISMTPLLSNITRWMTAFLRGRMVVCLFQGATSPQFICPGHDCYACPSLCQITSVWLAREEHFVMVPPNLVVHGPSGSSVRASPSEGIEVPPLRPAPQPGLSARREVQGDWLHGFRLVGFPSPDVVRWSAASG